MMPWYISQDEEHCHGKYETREDAIEGGRGYWGTEPFFIAEGQPFKNQCPDFHAWFGEAFDDANADYQGEDGQGNSEDWTDATYTELCESLTAVANEWIDRHGYRNAYALDLRPSERITP